jgi:hypothetical protein
MKKRAVPIPLLQGEEECRAFIHFSLGPDMAAVIMDDPLCRGKADAKTRKFGCLSFDPLLFYTVRHCS